jgi:glycosyltransferase involved in cell wall biosynthesis
MLTILIPSYNHEKFILDCLRAACEIEVNDKKIIIIDDGSIDGTEIIVNQFVAENKSQTLDFIRKNNSGLVSSLNLGLALTNTEFLYIVASDDIPNSKGIQDCINVLESNPSCQFCIGGGVAFIEGRKPSSVAVYGRRQHEFFAMEEKQRYRAMFLNYPSPLLLQSTVFRTSALREIGGWDARIVLDDYATFIKLLSRFPNKNIDFIYKPEYSVVKYRQHASNSYKNLTRQFFIVKQALDALTPPELIEHAVGNAVAYYFMVALRARKFASMGTILRAVSRKNIRHVLSAMVIFVAIRLQKLISKSDA